MKRDQVRLSYISFALLLEELMAGPSTAKTLSDHTGMGHRYMCRLLSYLHGKRLIHIANWEKDSIGRVSVRVYGLGQGRDAKRPTKPRQAINRDYRAKAAGAVLAGTPFAGLMA